MSNMTRHEFFIKRCNELGVLDKDSDYDGMIGESVLELSQTFSNQGHSGASAELTTALFQQLMDEWKNPVTHGIKDVQRHEEG